VDYEDSSLREGLAQLDVISKQSGHRDTQLSCFELQCSKEIINFKLHFCLSLFYWLLLWKHLCLSEL